MQILFKQSVGLILNSSFKKEMFTFKTDNLLDIVGRF